MRSSSRTGLVVALALVGTGLALTTGSGWAMEDPVAPKATKPVKSDLVKPNPHFQPQARRVEYAMFKKRCTTCHDSVADPEKPGKDRDEWYRVVNLMQGHGLVTRQSEADMIVDLLFALRRGKDGTPG